MGIYSKTFEKNQYNLQAVAQKSSSWFQGQAKLLAGQGIQPLSLIKSDARQNVNRVTPGELYLFMYDAKHQDTLPYWDMFPLVFPISRTKDAFLGLNMHYLPYNIRIQLLDKLMDFKSNNKLNENTKLKMSWDVISAASRYPYVKSCVHKYLISHLQTPLKKIDSADWATAMMLPVERFVGASKQRVWSESLK